MAISLPSLAITKNYQLCHDLSEITDPDNTFLMVSAKPLGGNFYAAPAATSTSAKCVAVLESDILPETLILDAEIMGVGLFSVQENGEYHALYESGQSRYWGASSSILSLASKLPLSTSTSVSNYQLTLNISDSNVKIQSAANKLNNFSIRYSKTSGASVYPYREDAIDEGVYSIYTLVYPVFYKEVKSDVEAVLIEGNWEQLSPTVTLSCETEGAEILYGFNENDITTTYSGPFTVSEECTVYAKAKLGDKESLVSERLIDIPYTSFKQFLAKGKSDDLVHFVGNFQVLFQSSNKYYTLLTDGVSNMMVYDLYNTKKLEAGNKISSIGAKATLSSYQMQLTDVEFKEGGYGATYEPYEIDSLSEINYNDNLYDGVIIRGCSISDKSYNSATITLSNSETVTLTNSFSISYENGENYDIIGYVGRAINSLKIIPVSIVEGATIETVKTPVITPNKHELNVGEKVSISCATPNAKIYYTLDGSEPTQASTPYTAAFDFEGDVTVSARAYYEEDDVEMKPSAIATRTYHMFDPTCNIITADNHDHDSSFESHTCNIDNVDYAMNGGHDPIQGLHMNNTSTRTCYIIQISDNGDYVLDKIEVDFSDNSNNITFNVRASNKPYSDGSNGSTNNIRSNGELIGTINNSNPSLTFTDDYKYFALYPKDNGQVFMNSVTLRYREMAPVTDAPELSDDLASGFDNDEETLTIPQLPSDENWIAMYQVNDGDAIEAATEGTTLHEEALDGATLQSIKIWYEHQNGIHKTEPKEYFYLTSPRFSVKKSDDQTTIDFGQIGEGVSLYFTLNGSMPVISNTEQAKSVKAKYSATRAASQNGEYIINSADDLTATHVLTSENTVVKINAGDDGKVPAVKLAAQAVHSEKGLTSRLAQSDITTGVESIMMTDDADGIYYNLQGVKVTNPEKGTFIRITNGKATKVIK